jgi:hypothetical protein
MAVGNGKERTIGDRGMSNFSVMFTHVLKMGKMNNINHNGRYGTSLSIVLWLAINSMKSTIYYFGKTYKTRNLLKLRRA